MSFRLYFFVCMALVSFFSCSIDNGTVTRAKRKVFLPQSLSQLKWICQNATPKIKERFTMSLVWMHFRCAEHLDTKPSI